jgi:C-terminal processing protease CtpA/Prc
MQSRGVPMKLIAGENVEIPYGMNMTNADVITTDGKSLEHIGVTPNVVTLLTGADLASQSDPVLAAALKLLGEDVAPETAGKFFPFKWKEE